jgi:hypothetical protein
MLQANQNNPITRFTVYDPYDYTVAQPTMLHIII